MNSNSSTKSQEFVSSHADEIVVAWVASREYFNEARKSAQSVARHMPEIRRVLITADPYESVLPPFHSTWHPASPVSRTPWYLQSTELLVEFYLTAAFQLVLYLDTDTYMLAPIYDALAVAWCFDITGAHAPARITGESKLDIPDAFPEINIGVTLFKNSLVTAQVMRQWREYYRSYTEFYGDNDQGPLRDAMWSYSHLGFRPYILPPEYNCRFGFGGFACYPVKILHSRAKTSMEEIGQHINATKGMRAWTRGQYS